MGNKIEALFVLGYSIVMLFLTILVMKPNSSQCIKRSYFYYKVILWSIIVGLSLYTILLSLSRLLR